MISRQMVLLVAAILYSANCTAADKPNIVYILADDMGTGDVSCFNPASKIKTANLDRLAAAGVKFTDAHSGSSVCTPTRYGLLTGRYSWRTTLKERVLNSYSPCLIPKERDTVASLLKRHGYTTAIIGKWHLGLDWTPKEGKNEVNGEEDVDFAQPIKHGPLDLGFDHWYGVAASWDMAPYAFIEDRKIQGTLVRTSKEELFPGPQEHLDADEAGKDKNTLKEIAAKYPKATWRPGLKADGIKATDAMPMITRHAVKYIAQQNSDKPFFLYLPLTAPHTPVVPGESFRGKSSAGSYGDFALEVDWVVGEVVGALRQLGLLENTLLIFTADNGASPKAIPQFIIDRYDHNPHYLYAGAKGRVLEGGHRVPFIASWPVNCKPDTVCSSPVSLNDLYATCAELLSEKIADSVAEDSVSMLAELRGDTATTERLLASIKDPDDRSVLIAAHRGGYTNDVADDAPENSVANVAVAVSRGYEVFETDIQRTSDGVFVMVHDPTLERETNGTGTVESKTLKELQQLRKRFRDGTLSNHKVATLTELLDAGNGKILLKPDLKPGVIDHFDQLARLISNHPAAKQVFLRTVMGNANAIAKCFANGTPKVEVMFKVKKASQVQKIHKLFSPVTIQIDIREGEPLSESRLEAIRTARELGILVETHAYDSPEQTATLLDAGVRMLHTKKPDTIRKLLNARSSKTEAADHVRDETTQRTVNEAWQTIDLRRKEIVAPRLGL